MSILEFTYCSRFGDEVRLLYGQISSWELLIDGTERCMAVLVLEIEAERVGDSVLR